jgi:hypothetical protein
MLIYISPCDLCKLGFFSGTAVTSLIAVLVLLILQRK